MCYYVQDHSALHISDDNMMLWHLLITERYWNQNSFSLLSIWLEDWGSAFHHFENSLKIWIFILNVTESLMECTRHYFGHQMENSLCAIICHIYLAYVCMYMFIVQCPEKRPENWGCKVKPYYIFIYLHPLATATIVPIWKTVGLRILHQKRGSELGNQSESRE